MDAAVVGAAATASPAARVFATILQCAATIAAAAAPAAAAPVARAAVASTKGAFT